MARADTSGVLEITSDTTPSEVHHGQMAVSALLLTSGPFTLAGVLPAQAAEQRCFGSKPTIVGTPYEDRIRGTASSDVIVSLGGSDTIRGRGGDDLICAGSGYDYAYGGPGSDRLSGGKDVDHLLGEGGNDELNAGAGGDTLNGGAGNDSVLGGPGHDEIEADPGDDSLDAGGGHDFLNFEEALGSVSIDLTAGTISGVGTDTVARVEGVLGSSYNDTIVGNADANILYGADGNDVISGMGGDDVGLFFGLGGGEGDDTLIGGDGDDSLDGGPGNDLIEGGLGEDIVSFGFSEGPLRVDLRTGSSTGDGTDTLVAIEDVFGSAGDDALIGDAGPNRLFGGEDGVDTISGDAGDDLLVGDVPSCWPFPCNGEGVNDDVLDGGDGLDTVSYHGAEGPVHVDLAARTATGEGSDTLIGIENVEGSRYRDTLTGDAVANRLSGSRGKDTLSGAEGDDALDGGAGKDTLDGGLGTDTCINGESVTNCETGALTRSLRSIGSSLLQGCERNDWTECLPGHHRTGRAPITEALGQRGSPPLHGLGPIWLPAGLVRPRASSARLRSRW